MNVPNVNHIPLPRVGALVGLIGVGFMSVGVRARFGGGGGNGVRGVHVGSKRVLDTNLLV